MVLATIIRLEMAYPGVGILAGDSLQYLSVVTAHAVIMVFFMIMPLLFGAFGNFLLPTQLGVHDVAFPRLNSAAFWFLPAGLLMLVQLVCLDRRYQRMNCYNIREIQTILKSKYSPNTSISTDVHFALSDTSIGLRYQLGGLGFTDNSTLTYYRNSVAADSRLVAAREFLYSPLTDFHATKLFANRASALFYVLQSVRANPCKSASTTSAPTLRSNLTSNVAARPITYTEFYMDSLFSEAGLTAFVRQLYSPHPETFNTEDGTPFNFSQLKLTSSEIVRFSAPSVLPQSAVPFALSPLASELFDYSPTLRDYAATEAALSSVNVVETPLLGKGYNAGSGSAGVLHSSANLLQEQSHDQRFMRFMNPVFKYDFKVGNYMPDEAKKMNPHLLMSIKDVTTGVRKSSWFTSVDFSSLLQSTMASHLLLFSDYAISNPSRSKLSSASVGLDGTFSPDSPHATDVNFAGGFYNFFLLTATPEALNSRWLAVNALDQKFYRMFAAGSLQQRVHANWRQLKFTREA